MMGVIAGAFSWFAAEYLKEYRESRIRVYETIVKNNMHLNQIILTVSIASLAAIAALNKEVFVPYPVMSFAVLALFLLVILFSTVNFYLAGLVLRDIQQTFTKDLLFPIRISRGEYRPRFQLLQKVLSIAVFGGFCLGLIALLVLLGFYILEAKQ